MWERICDIFEWLLRCLAQTKARNNDISPKKSPSLEQLPPTHPRRLDPGAGPRVSARSPMLPLGDPWPGAEGLDPPGSYIYSVSKHRFSGTVRWIPRV